MDFLSHGSLKFGPRVRLPAIRYELAPEYVFLLIPVVLFLFRWFIYFKRIIKINITIKLRQPIHKPICQIEVHQSLRINILTAYVFIIEQYYGQYLLKQKCQSMMRRDRGIMRIVQKARKYEISNLWFSGLFRKPEHEATCLRLASICHIVLGWGGNT